MRATAAAAAMAFVAAALLAAGCGYSSGRPSSAAPGHGTADARRTAGPRPAGPHHAGPRTAGPHHAGPHHAGPRTAGPHHGGPRHAGRGRGLARFAATVSGPLSAADVPFSWHPGCPVRPAGLRAIRLSYLGFDGSAHTGEIIVAASVTRQVIRVFATLYRSRFPIAAMRPVDAFHGSDPRSMAADNTSGFNCRRAVAPGPPRWSMHAYGLAIDVNTVQNPYVEAGTGVQPPAGAGFVDRSRLRPGMAYRGGALVAAFSAVGWRWGGDWAGSPDYQHFSVNGR